ncbi:uncharacterized protein METZ01_LOCUS394772 [marine metagenome]|uniref:Uncharacterized protein n=1 Tax=marine metagenome TaxID=408172 RepID=A0A382V7M9_9ZZZZ
MTPPAGDLPDEGYSFQRTWKIKTKPDLIKTY